MIDFATLQGLTIPEGVVTQITDAAGNVLWALSSSDTVVLEVEKITSNTYAGETTYENEQFILLDIYPKTNGTVSVTYGGVTKTITDTSGAEEPNAQRVFFGTFNGVSDSVATPASGELTIEGDYYAFGCSSYSTGSKSSNVSYYNKVLSIKSLGCVTSIPDNAFGHIDTSFGTSPTSFASLTTIRIPDTVNKIGSYAFAANQLSRIVIPSNVVDMGYNPFCAPAVNESPKEIVFAGNAYYEKNGNCIIELSTGRVVFGFGNINIPSNAKIIGKFAFYHAVFGYGDIEIPNGVTTIEQNAFVGVEASIITIPSSVQTVEAMAFDGLGNSDITIKILATTPPTVNANTSFRGDYPIVVPKGCGETYKAAPDWVNYADRVVEES